MNPVALPRFGALTVIVLLLGQVGCATTRRGVPSTPAVGAAAVVERDGEACEAFAREESEVVRRQDQGLRSAERERFQKRAGARLSQIESLGYVQSRDGSQAAYVDVRMITTGIVLAVTAVQAAVWPIRWAAESAGRQTVTYEAAMRDCLKARATADSREPEPPELAQTLHDVGIRYLAHGDYAEAERLFRRALAIQGESLFPTHTAVAGSLRSLVGLYQARGQDSDASRLQAWLRQPIRTDQPTPVEVAGQAVAPCSALGC